MKAVEKEIEVLIVNKSQIIVTLKDVLINDEIGTVTFRKYSTASLGMTSFGLLPFERYFIIAETSNDKVTFECTKEEGNSLYKYVKDKREFNFDK
jgi:hypothetical protein